MFPLSSRHTHANIKANGAEPEAEELDHCRLELQTKKKYKHLFFKYNYIYKIAVYAENITEDGSAMDVIFAFQSKTHARVSRNHIGLLFLRTSETSEMY